MSVIKRDRTTSMRDLIVAVDKFVDLLEGEGENEAIDALKDAIKPLRARMPVEDPSLIKESIAKIIDAFEGEQELSSYIIQKPNPNDWTSADELSQGATRVLNLARRLRV